MASQVVSLSALLTTLSLLSSSDMLLEQYKDSSLALLLGYLTYPSVVPSTRALRCQEVHFSVQDNYMPDVAPCRRSSSALMLFHEDPQGAHVGVLQTYARLRK